MAFVRIFVAVLCFSFPLWVTSGFAQTESLHISTFHSDYGGKLLREGNAQQAMDQFIRALFFSPSNKLANEQLLNLLQDKEIETKSVRMQIFRLTELAEYITFLRDRLQRLEKQNTENMKYLLAETLEDDPIKEEVRSLAHEWAGDKSSLVIQPEGIQRGTANRQQMLADVSKYFVTVKESLLTRFSLALSISERLNTLRMQLVKSVSEKQRLDLADNYKRQMITRDKDLRKQEIQVKLLQKDLATVRSDFEYLYSKMNGTSEKVAELTSKITMMSLQIYEKDGLLAEKEALITRLQGDLNDARQRWELAQKIIKEKDGAINNLEQHAFGDRPETVAPGDVKVQALQESLSALQREMGEQETLNRQTIAALRKEFLSLQEQYGKLEQDFGGKELEIGRLRKVITAKNKKLNDVAEFFDAYDKDIVQLNGVLEIYKSKLSETIILMMDKDRKLQDMEKEVSGLKQQIENRAQEKSDKEAMSFRFEAGDLNKGDVLQKTKSDLQQMFPDYLPVNSR